MVRLPARARVLLAVLALLLCSAAPVSAAVPQRGADSGVTPVVLVHGYNADPGVWGSFRADLLASGYREGDVFAWGYDTSQSVNETLSGRFAAYVDQVRAQTGARKVDIVAHSFGSLVTRWYVKYGGGTATVDHWVSLGGPNHGTGVAWACALWSQACRDMTPGSYVQTRLAQGDETPGEVRYGTWWSNCDEVIDPDSSVLLNRADNHPAGCLAHNDLLTDDTVSQQVRSFLHG
ncbi:esterase/lipase family protein [Streptomyces sp. NPDC017958]|uniref:esterase/lipase family protein n=1 Tax=Streptomyces sp. NPDC017958 TaxID=3365021 RepID=UPI0037BD252F